MTRTAQAARTGLRHTLILWASIALAACGSASAQAPAAPAASPDAGLKEVRIDSKTFARGVPVPGWSLPTWELLVRQARRADLLARIAALLAERGLLDAVPAAPRAHLDAALIVVRSQHEEIDREERVNICSLGRRPCEAVSNWRTRTAETGRLNK